ncbi:structural maintenance of chromosomes protein 2-like isoform X2 [Dysidea avara]|uniref:structural maintenance of chromosomes protein 2-like isoform X2 n=1 Tax=Dysidea avara TaxID=196820 RepID=UPI00333287EB
MWIKEVVIDGFKSYAERTEIGQFDSQFNAITGLNGSGKSNILDSICFVLGISNLSQGRITKVLNMKPPEILSMIEEAAGTRMYESKRLSAQKTIDKKAIKLTEIDTVLTSDILPLLEKLRGDRSLYLEYQKILRELEHLNRLLIAQQYCEAQKLQIQATAKMEALEEEMTSLRNKTKECVAEKDKALAAVAELEEQQRQETKRTPLGELEKAVDEAGNALALIEANLKNSKERLVKEKGNLSSLQHACAEDKSLLSSKEAELASHQQKLEKTLTQQQAAQQADDLANQHYQALSLGVTNDKLQTASLAQQVIALQGNIAIATDTVKQAERRLQHTKKQLVTKEKSSRDSQKAYNKDQSVVEGLHKELSAIEVTINKLGYKEDKKRELEAKRSDLLNKISSLEEQVEQLEARYPGLQFSYHTPHEGFDHNKVYGVVAKLVDLTDHKYATALEVTAGGKLYNVVVDTEETAKQLLNNGRLQRHCTIIPLNKITSQQLPAKLVTKAQSLVGKDHVRSALDVVGYKPAIKPAMQFVFGSTLLCDQLKQAQQVAFDREVMTRCVTLSGDVFNPSGSLTGGSRPKTQPILLAVVQLKQWQTELEDYRNQLAVVENELMKIDKLAASYHQLKTQWDGKNREVLLATNRLEQSSHHKLLVEVKELQEEIDSLQKNIEEAQSTKSASEAQLEDVKEKMADAEGYHQREIKKAEEAMNKARKQAQQVTKETNKMQQQVKEIKLDIDELNKAIETQEQEIATCQQSCTKLTSEVDQHVTQEQTAKAKLKEEQTKLQQQKAILEETNKELRQLHQLCHNKDEMKNELVVKMKELDHQISKHHRDTKDAVHKVEVLSNQYEWINTDKQLFGQPNTAYDFSTTSSRDSADKLTRLQEQKDTLSKKVNMRAMTMFGRAEERYNDLMKKKKIVENDKAKIEALIIELDEKKNAAIQGAFQQVNKDFGSIFSTLLPGTSAKLSPMEGHGVLDGLEVRVAFSGVWKESLTELSGGQRSLVALSLILSLLLFKPAPLYILDEVDAALDLSHTQNVGQMIKTHFKHSQFIVVSLKDGMFTNANVLFKTKFVDGKSTVTRFLNPKVAAVTASDKKHKKGTTQGKRTVVK